MTKDRTHSVAKQRSGQEDETETETEREVIEGSSQHLSLLQNADQTRKTTPAQAQKRRGRPALVGWLAANQPFTFGAAAF
jgi:hypothetical protein